MDHTITWTTNIIMPISHLTDYFMGTLLRMSTPSLELKGSSFTLSVLHIHSNNLEQISTELDSKLAQAPQFFIGAPLVLNLSAIAAQVIDIEALAQLLIARKLVIVGVTGASKEQNIQAKQAGLAQIKAGKQTHTPPTANTN